MTLFLEGMAAGLVLAVGAFYLVKDHALKAASREHAAYQRGLARAGQSGEHVHCEPGAQPPA